METDLHGYVLARLDAHLADLQALERELTRSRLTWPDARRQAVLAASVAARAFAHDLARAVGGAPPEARTSGVAAVGAHQPPHAAGAAHPAVGDAAYRPAVTAHAVARPA